MNSKFIKYCNLKAATVIVLLFAFNFVSFGQDIHDCLCKPEKPKAETKKSGCSKEEKSHETEKAAKDDCCKTNGSKSCNDCKTCSIEKKKEKEQGTLNESKISKTEIKVTTTEPSKTLNNTFIKSYSSDFSPGTGTKSFLKVSNLRI